MPEGIITDRSHLIQLANQQCGYRAVEVGPHDTGRISNKGNLVIEHPDYGTEDVCTTSGVKHGNLQHGHAGTSVTFDRHGDVTGVTPPDYTPSAPPRAGGISP